MACALLGSSSMSFRAEWMLYKRKIIQMEKEGKEVPLLISGNSMAPFLVHGRDTVFLSKIMGRPKKCDMVLYRRKSGEYILHRVYKAEGDCFSFVGDAQSFIENDIAETQLLAVVKAVRRKGNILTSGSFWWEFFEKMWINMIPLRAPAVVVYTKLCRK